MLLWLAMLAVVLLPALIAGLLVARPAGVAPHGIQGDRNEQGAEAKEQRATAG